MSIHCDLGDSYTESAVVIWKIVVMHSSRLTLKLSFLWLYRCSLCVCWFCMFRQGFARLEQIDQAPTSRAC
jgi:hypothetical protein